jgi:hypothetical protein
MPRYITKGLYFKDGEVISPYNIDNLDFVVKENSIGELVIVKNRYGNSLMKINNLGITKKDKKHLRILRRMHFLSKKWY